MSEEQNQQQPQQQESLQEEKKEQQQQQIIQSERLYDVELIADAEDKGNLQKVQITGAGSETTSFKLFNTKRGRDLVFKFILEALKSKSESESRQIQLSAKSSAIYVLLQAITELQHEKKITVVQTQNLTSSQYQQVLAFVTVSQ